MEIFFMGHEFEELFHIEMLSKVLEQNNKMSSYKSLGLHGILPGVTNLTGQSTSLVTGYDNLSIN